MESIGVIIADKTFIIPVLFNIEIITLKRTTNPPIITTVLIDDNILACKMLPKLDSLGGVFFSLSV